MDGAMICRYCGFLIEFDDGRWWKIASTSAFCTPSDDGLHLPELDLGDAESIEAYLDA